MTKTIGYMGYEFVTYELADANCLAVKSLVHTVMLTPGLSHLDREAARERCRAANESAGYDCYRVVLAHRTPAGWSSCRENGGEILA